MNSIAQHAVTNGYGNSENLRAQPTSSSFFVDRYSNARRAALAPLDRRAIAGMIGIGIVATRYSVTASSSRMLVDVEQDQDEQRTQQMKNVNSMKPRERLCARAPTRTGTRSRGRTA